MPEPAQRTHQYPGLRLHALYRGYHQHHAVEDLEHPFHLRDEAGVTRGIDQVDDRTVDLEGDHRGLDRDAASALKGQVVGLGLAVVDPADVVDDPAAYSSRSVSEVLPASTCARIPRLSMSQSRILDVDRLGGHEQLAHRVIVS